MSAPAGIDWLSYLIEIRRRSVSALMVFFALFAIFFFFADQVFVWIFHPLARVLPDGQTLIVTSLTATFLTPLNLAFQAALCFTMPMVLYHLWHFTAPGLYQHERRGFAWLISGSLLLFVSGVIFCFYGILPWMFQFFAHAVPKGVQFMPDMTPALDFIIRMLMLFGLFFQIPLICVMAVRLHWISLSSLQMARPYVIVAAFVFGMLFTPPDVLSQVLLAVPLWLLFEAGLLLARMFQRF